MHFDKRALLVRFIGKPIWENNRGRLEHTHTQQRATYLTKPYPRETPVTGSSIIFALLQLRKGRMKRGSRSLRNPRTGLRKTATRSELDTSGARSPTKMLYSFGYCGFWPLGRVTDWPGTGGGTDAEGTDDAQLSENGLLELGITMEFPSLLLIWDNTDAAWVCDGKVRKQ